MQETKTDVVKKVLDYWYTMEFLSQEKFPKWNENDKRKARIAENEEYKRRNAVKEGKEYQTPKFPAKMLQMFCKLESGDDIYEFVRRSAEKHGMTRWGNITIYVGRIEREMCIVKIAEALKKRDERPETNTDKIAWSTLQVGPDGVYVEGSFSLSPVVWAVGQIADKEKIDSMSEVLDQKQYEEEQRIYDEIFTRVEREGRKKEEEYRRVEINGEEEKTYDLDEEGKYFKKAEYALSKEMILEQVGRIYSKYIDISLWKELSEKWNRMRLSSEERIECYLSYRLFQGEDDRDRYGDEEYTGLSKTYFTADLDMIRSRVDTLEKSENPMERELFHYIYSGFEEYYEEGKRRIDLLREQGRDADGISLKNLYLNILNIQKAPQGKWPSRYMPAFMQQVAINIAIEGKETIFSVNGPPGTGKTTMLKEIVVHNVVERAKLLAEFSSPDEAFIECDFSGGDKKSNAYSNWAQHYYVLKNDKINDYSILVASCNNSAVENVTKELPLEKGILDNLREMDEDSIAMKDDLRDIQQIFTVSKNEEVEWLKESDRKKAEKENKNGKTQKKQSSWEQDYHNIYFTRYARDLLQEENVWGLIAAPLGKRSNIRQFYDKVMSSLEFVIVGGANDERKERRMEEYRIAREKFKEQLQFVESFKDDQICKLENDIIAKRSELVDMEKHSVKFRKEMEEKERDRSQSVGKLNRRLQEVLENKNTREQEFKKVESSYKELCRESSDKKQAYKQVMEEIVQRDAGLNRFDRFFRTKRARDVWKLQEIFRDEAAELEQIVKKIEGEQKECLEKLQELERGWGECKEEETRLKQEVNKTETYYDHEIQEIQDNIDRYEQVLKICKKELTDKEALYERIHPIPDDWRDTEKFVWLDDAFMEDLMSDDEVKRTNAHVSNPWFYGEYNREREKLFYYALRLHEAFILASKSCRENLINLELLWQFKINEDKKRVRFSRKDKETAIRPLLQTLFLLVPVISTTFASVRSFLGDAGPGTIGTLIVDEAGQASPQLAVGALYRSRRAVIVGDPRQIEPVVTDDLRLIRETYNEKLYKPYVRKNISVQHFADFLNPYGTFFYDQKGEKEWVGCPLVVHRRCIAPMYEISNWISYNGIMKQQTALPSKEKEEKFCYPTSRWIQVKGSENGNRNHFVAKQGEVVIEILEKAFEKSDNPNIYIISPFTTVVKGMKEQLRNYLKEHENSFMSQSKYMEVWIDKKIGTVHTFQGRETDEVIFLLGCDTSDRAAGAIKWVNANIVNVAVTRAKYRLYVVGDKEAWGKSDYLKFVESWLDN